MKAVIIILLVSLFPFSGHTKHEKIVYIQPLGHVQVENIQAVKDAIRLFYGFDCVILQKVNHNTALYAASKSRYDAGKILEHFRDPAKHIIVVTEKDIATRKSDVFTEWGIFGLGSMNHLTCVVSTFRLRSSTDRLQKVTIHELGHNFGLNHCSYDKQCLMHAADGTLKQIDQEKLYFCKVCFSKLKY